MDMRGSIGGAIMFVADKNIKEKGESLISPFNEERVGPISYDLSSEEFYTTEDGEIRNQSEISLEPGESVFVSCVETVDLPDDMAAVINARNSKIRQGLRIDAPIYYPGHKTRVFFRVSNISKDVIQFLKDEQYAAIYFVKVDGAVERPYEGAFSDELNFRGMAEYRGAYEKAMRKIESKKDELKDMEKGIYANVLVLLTIFVALFSLININVGLARESTETGIAFRMLIFNLGTVGSIAMLISFAQTMIKSKDVNKSLLCIGVACFAVALVLAAWL